MRRSEIVRWSVVAALVLASLDAFAIEPYWIETTEHEVRGTVVAPLTIAHLSDLHTRGMGRRERALLERIQRVAPDIIVLTGDTVDSGNLEDARELLAQLHAPLGVWAVRGNWENWKRPTVDEHTFYRSVGATFLANEGAARRTDLWLAGLDDPMSGVADLTSAMRAAPPSAFRVTLVHAPGSFGSLAPKTDLVLAGHTHAGQVRLPLVGALWLPPGSGTFEAGWYASANARMYVSRGIGTSVLPVRFLCRPELAIVRVHP